MEVMASQKELLRMFTQELTDMVIEDLRNDGDFDPGMNDAYAYFTAKYQLPETGKHLFARELNRRLYNVDWDYVEQRLRDQSYPSCQ